MRKVHSLFPVTKTVTNISFTKDKLIITKYKNRKGEIDKVIPYYFCLPISKSVLASAISPDLFFSLLSIYDDDMAKKGWSQFV